MFRLDAGRAARHQHGESAQIGLDSTAAGRDCSLGSNMLAECSATRKPSTLTGCRLRVEVATAPQNGIMGDV